MEWRELEIESFESMGAEEFFKTPHVLLKILVALRVPVRIFENNIWQPEKDGFLEEITKKHGSMIVIINIKDPTKRGRKPHEIVFKKSSEKSEITVGLPVLN